jgi:hypothetical protein
MRRLPVAEAGLCLASGWRSYLKKSITLIGRRQGCAAKNDFPVFGLMTNKSDGDYEYGLRLAYKRSFCSID